MGRDWLRRFSRRGPGRRPGIAGWPEERPDAAGILFSAGVHLLAAALVLVSPFIGRRAPVLPEVYQVELVNVAEYRPPAKRPARAGTRPKKVRLKKAAPVAAAPRPAAVSLNPIRSRLRKEVKRLEEAEQLELAARLQRLRSEAEARRRRELAREKARQAVRALAESLHTAAPAGNGKPLPEPDTATTAPEPQGAATTPAQETETGDHPAAARGMGGIMSATYLNRLGAIIQRNWILPDLQKKWPRTMQARIRVSIDAHGRITGLRFLKRARDFRFNVQAEKALRKSAPFPPPPPEIADEAREIILTFTPEEVR